MKKLILFVGVLFIAHVSYGQIFSWGLKAGVNSSKISFDDFSVDPDITIKPDYLPGGANAGDLLVPVNGSYIINPRALDLSAKVTFEPSSYDMGYHFGAFVRLKLLGIFIQPELIFSQTNTTINISEGENIKDGTDLISEIKKSSTDIKYTNFDIPIMVGVKLGPLRLNAGPVATFKLGNKAGASPTDEINEMVDDFTTVSQKATFGGQAGIGLDILKKVTIDVRYEFPLSKLGDNVTIDGNSFSTDQRQSQIIASIGIMF